MLNALAREPTSWAMRFNSSSKTSHRRLVKISGRMKSLYFAASFAPRMDQAASQIQDSRDLSPLAMVSHFVLARCAANSAARRLSRTHSAPAGLQAQGQRCIDSLMHGGQKGFGYHGPALGIGALDEEEP